jgi:hypothetical protein
VSAQDIKAGIERFALGDRPDVAVLYPDVCFASLESVGDMPVPLLVESVLAGWTPESHLTTPTGSEVSAPFPVASLVVSRDSPTQFHPELSNREPVEIQIWADGRVSLEIEFQGVDVTTAASTWTDTAERVLRAWAATYGVTLIQVFNDRARSLPDVWNASFTVTTPREHVVRELVQLGERALRTAELSMTGWGAEDDVRRLLTDGDAHAVLGWQPSAVLEFWAAPPAPDEEHLLAADVCALANGVRGGTVVIGIQVGPAGAELLPFAADDQVERVDRLIRERLFPVPERLTVSHLPVRADGEGDDLGVLVVRVPPQDDLLRPFLVFGVADVGDGNSGYQIALVERDGADSITRSVAAVHAALAAGTALLRGTPDPGRQPGVRRSEE